MASHRIVALEARLLSARTCEGHTYCVCLQEVQIFAFPGHKDQGAVLKGC